MGEQADQTVEIKARCDDFDRVREILRSWGATCLCTEHQEDTFFHAPLGRLKLRRSEIQSCLIGYQRADLKGPKHCRVGLCPTPDAEALGRTLALSLGVRLKVNKARETFLLENVRFHLDRVESLGDFVKIEVLGREGVDSVEQLRARCEHFMRGLGITPSSLVGRAYVDLLEESSPGGRDCGGESLSGTEEK